MPSPHALRLVALASLLAAGGAACGAAPVTIAQVDAAYAASDLAFLERVCSGGAAATAASKPIACERRDEVQAKATVNKTACAELPSVADGFLGKGLFVEDVAAERAIACGNWAWIFESLVWLPSARETLRELERKRRPVSDELGKYAASHRGPSFLPPPKQAPKQGEAQGGGFATWLVEQGPKHCAAIAEAAAGASPFAREVAIHYLAEAKCKEGQKVALEALGDPGVVRIDACRWLGAFGDASTLEKVKVVGETDSYTSREKSGVLGYPVRTTCTDAYGKIKLRR